MHHSHQLDKQKDQDFLLQQRVDPITGELIEAGHKIVICSACKSAFFEESWEYLGGKHCNQTKTLTKIPIAQTLWLKAKPLEFLPFDFEGFDKKLHYQNLIYYSTRLLLALILFSSLKAAITAFRYEQTPLVCLLILIALLSLAINLGIKTILLNFPVSYHKHIMPIPNKHKLAIDVKKQMLIFRNDRIELELPLDAIQEVRYSFSYIEGDKSRYKDLCNLESTIYFTENNRTKTRLITTTLRKIYIDKWEDLLRKMPLHIKLRKARYQPS